MDIKMRGELPAVEEYSYNYTKLQTQKKTLWCVLMHVIKDLEDFLCNKTMFYAMSQES